MSTEAVDTQQESSWRLWSVVGAGLLVMVLGLIANTVFGSSFYEKYTLYFCGLGSGVVIGAITMTGVPKSIKSGRWSKVVTFIAGLAVGYVLVSAVMG